MTSPVDEIKERLDVVELIGGYIKLQKAGRNYKACCPFHSEKTPSFMVSPERQMWHCFGCQKGGSVFDFVMEMENVEFGDALKTLAERAGVKLDRKNPNISRRLNTERVRLCEICELASRFFVKQLEGSRTGKRMGEYLARRGLKPETIRKWRIGYAPGQWRALSDFLNNRGHSDGEILKTGLSIRNEQKNSQYDRFRDRIIFPIFDANGAIVGFTGRENPNVPNENMGKYINTPNTPIYDKSRILYGLDRAKGSIRANRTCILVEGQMDVIAAHQAGFENVVAGSGTALTPYQLKLIKRYSDNLAMAYDMDLAGEAAAKRGLDLAMQSGLETKVIILPDGQDPADCISQDSARWKSAVKDACGLMEFYVTSAFKRHRADLVSGKKAISAALLPVLKKIPNKIEQAHWLEDIASRLKVKENVLREEMECINVDFAGNADYREFPTAQEKKEEAKMPRLEEYMIGLLFAHPKSVKKYPNDLGVLLASQDAQTIFYAIKGNTGTKKKLLKPLTDLAEYLAFSVEAQEALSEDFDYAKEIELCCNRLLEQRAREVLSAHVEQIRNAEQSGSRSLQRQLAKKCNSLAQMLQSVKQDKKFSNKLLKTLLKYKKVYA